LSQDLPNFAIILVVPRKILQSIIFVALFSFVFAIPSFAQQAPQFKDSFVQGKITKILKQETEIQNGVTNFVQQFKIQLLSGSDKGKTVSVNLSSDPKDAQKLNINEAVVVDVKTSSAGKQYSIYEPYRLNYLLFALIGFMLLIGLIGGRRGVGAIIGLLVSVGIIGLWIIPQILKGADPLTVSLIGAFAILVFTTYIAHGVSLKTTVAIVGTTTAFLFAGWLATTMVSLMHATGLGSEDIYDLQLGVATINPQGLLLSGILIGTLGALNDITTTQAITMFTLVKENPSQKLWDLFTKGMVIGREHIASLINTLILAYAGSSLAVLIFFELNPMHLPWWVILNNESTMEEIIKSLVGSSALILAVPITTLLATWVALEGTDAKKFLQSLFG